MYVEGVLQSTEENTYRIGSNRRMEKVAQWEHLVWSRLLNQEGCKKYTQNFVDSITPSCYNVANFLNNLWFSSS